MKEMTDVHQQLRRTGGRVILVTVSAGVLMAKGLRQNWRRYRVCFNEQSLFCDTEGEKEKMLFLCNMR